MNKIIWQKIRYQIHNNSSLDIRNGKIAVVILMIYNSVIKAVNNLN